MEYVVTRVKEGQTDDLMHYGVLGMKWGKRKAQYSNSSTKKSSAQVRADRAKEEAASARKLADKYVSAMDKKAAKRQSQADAKAAKVERKAKIKDTYKEINKNASFKERLIYNDATRKKAAKYVVDQNMSLQDAKNKANADARRNTAIVLGTYGAIAVASLYAANR